MFESASVVEKEGNQHFGYSQQIAPLHKSFANPVMGDRVLSQGFTYVDSLPIVDELLSNVWYLPTADKKAKLYVTSLGKGPQVITLHGGPGNDFHYLIDAIKAHRQTYQFVLFDQRGSLLSPLPDSDIAQLSLKTLVEDLESLRQALGRQKLVLLAHSFGSRLALAYYQTYPQHVAGLVLLASVPPSLNEKTYLEWTHATQKRLQLMRNRPSVQAAMQKAGVADTSVKLTPQQESIRYKIDGLASFNLYRIENWPQFKGGRVYYNAKVDAAISANIPKSYDIRPLLQSHPIPITVIQGDQDYIDPKADSWKTLTRTTSIQLEVIPQAGHYSWLDDPDSFRKHLDKALTRSIP